MLKVGDKAPDFKLQAADGKEIALAGLRGKPVFLPQGAYFGLNQRSVRVSRRQTAV
jgi:peroxiredoxin